MRRVSLRRSGERWVAAVLLVLSGLPTACGSAPPPVHPVLQQRSDKIPVVLVPGLTGTTLVDRESEQVLWGRGKNLLFPRDGGHSVALPIAPEDATGWVRSGVEPGEVIRSISLLGITKPIYGPLFRLLEAQGYRLGDLERPEPDATFYPFAYDWRQDKIVNAGKLAAALERLRRARGEDRLPVILICQSCGAHLCRWLAKYGGGTLEEAEGGTAAPPATLDVRRVVLVGSSSGGSLRILRELHRGRRYVPLGRHLRPEVLFTYRSLYQDLPAYRSEYFVNGNGETIPVDLYDPEAWRRYGWSVFDPDVRRRVERSGRTDLLGTEEERFAYLTRRLDRAGRFQRLLRADAPGFGGTRYSSIQGTQTPTPDRAVLEPKPSGKGGWRLLFAGDGPLERRPRLRERVVSPGDEHATVASQEWLSPQESAVLTGDPLHAEGGHFELLLDDATERRLLEILAEP